MTVDALLRELAARIAGLSLPHPTKVAIDGVDAAGKTTLADSLARHMREGGHEIIRASVDGFHKPRADRYARGELSPVGYYEDSFDCDKLVQLLLLPLSEQGPSEFRREAFDYVNDTPVKANAETCSPNAILLFDGVFLLRPELNSWWDYRVFVDVSRKTTLQRGITRDAPQMGGRKLAERRYLRRYFPGQDMYFQRVRPRSIADAIVRNDNPIEPDLVERRDA